MGHDLNRHQVLVISSIVLVLLVLSFILRVTKLGNNQKSGFTEVSNSEDATQAEAEVNHFDGWKIYNADKIGINFIYPKDFLVKYESTKDLDTYKIYDSSYVPKKGDTAQEIRDGEKAVTLTVYPYNKEQFASLKKDLEKEIDRSDNDSGVAHTEVVVDANFGIKGFYLYSSLSGDYFKGLFRIKDSTVSFECLGNAASIATDILSNLALNSN